MYFYIDLSKKYFYMKSNWAKNCIIYAGSYFLIHKGRNLILIYDINKTNSSSVIKYFYKSLKVIDYMIICLKIKPKN